MSRQTTTQVTLGNLPGDYTYDFVAGQGINNWLYYQLVGGVTFTQRQALFVPTNNADIIRLKGQFSTVSTKPDKTLGPCGITVILDGNQAVEVAGSTDTGDPFEYNWTTGAVDLTIHFPGRKIEAVLFTMGAYVSPPGATDQISNTITLDFITAISFPPVEGSKYFVGAAVIQSVNP